MAASVHSFFIEIMIYYNLGAPFLLFNPPLIKVNFLFCNPAWLFMTPSLFIGSQKYYHPPY